MQLDFDHIYLEIAYERLKHLSKEPSLCNLYYKQALTITIAEIISSNDEIKAMLPNEKLVVIDWIFNNWTNQFHWVVLFAENLVSLGY